MDNEEWDIVKSEDTKNTQILQSNILRSEKMENNLCIQKTEMVIQSEIEIKEEIVNSNDIKINTIQESSPREKFALLLDQIFSKDALPKVRKKLVDNIIKIVVNEEKGVIRNAILLQKIMQEIKVLKVTGKQKKIFVKQVFKASSVMVSDENLRDGMTHWIDSGGDELIDQFVTLAPKLFKQSTWVKIWDKRRAWCCCN